MLDLVDALHVFELGILDNNSRTKRFVNGDVDVAANRRGNHKASVLPVIGWKVGASAAETYPQRAPGDDHRAGLECGKTAAFLKARSATEESKEREFDKCPHPGQRAKEGIILK